MPLYCESSINMICFQCVKAVEMTAYLFCISLNDMYKFETYINGFLDLEYPIFDPKHVFPSSVEVEIISFCQRRQPFAFSAFYVQPLALTFEGGSPSKFDK